MAPPRKRSLTETERETCATASAAVAAAQADLTRATAKRHQLWMKLLSRGRSQAAIADASGVIRQAVGYVHANQPD